MPSLVIPECSVEAAARVGGCSFASECSFASYDAKLHSLVGSPQHRTRPGDAPLDASIAAFSCGKVSGVTMSETVAHVECSCAAGGLPLPLVSMLCCDPAAQIRPGRDPGRRSLASSKSAFEKPFAGAGSAAAAARVEGSILSWLARRLGRGFRRRVGGV